MSPTARSLKLLRASGFTADVVERWIPGANIRRDMFGFGDLLAVHPGERAFLIVQATSLSNVAARLKKAKALATLRTWLQAGGQFEVWGWSKRGDRWEVRRVAGMAEELKSIEIDHRPKRGRTSVQPGLFD